MVWSIRAGHTIGADFAVPWSRFLARARRDRILGLRLSRICGRRERTTAASPSVVGFTGFHYPPMYLVIILPLAMLPYAWSLLAWTVTTFAAYLGVMWKINPERDSLWLAIAFPGALVNLTNGQNGFLTLALLGGALLSSNGVRFSPACCSA